MITRRSFVKALAAVAGTLLVPLDRLAGEATAPVVEAQAPPAGEVCEGFLLLPEGTPLPSFVKPSMYGIPRFGHVEPGLGAITTDLGSAEELARKGRMLVYTLSQLPDGLRFAGATLVQHPTGEVYGGWARYESHNPRVDIWECTVDVWAQPDFPQPLPLWARGAGARGSLGALGKTSCLPVPGIVVRTGLGHVFHWVQGGVYYRLRAEYQAAREDAERLAMALSPVG
jgi:hypothetical protein